ncbi:MAG: hypothetical protein KKB50_10140 [Planctomycetes bacterium]|nr:hypothetical protein [Planctomycetota bacterium]
MFALSAVLTIAVFGAAPGIDAGEYFQIVVVDEQTGRGVPLVELQTVNNIRHYTDSNGIVAFHEPGLMDRDVFFFVKSHGYAFPADGFGMAGTALHVVAGGRAELKLKRLNIAERLYRVTGGGIYRDSVLAGQPVPLSKPILNGDVLGQDSIQNAVYRGRLYWFWGDTGWPKYPLGNFHMAGATSQLPSDGGLDPEIGVNLDYFTRPDGFAKKLAPRQEPGPVWLDAFVTLPGEGGQQRMYAAYARVTTAMEAVERGFMLYNDESQIFEKVSEFDLNAPVRPGGHPFIYADEGVEYIWFPNPLPLVRVRATAEAYLDLSQYEAWTPLKEGGRLNAAEIERDAAGRIRYAWKRNTPALDQPQQQELIKAGKLKPEEAWIHLQDADTGQAVLAHNGSVYWNEHRQRWITIRCECFGTSMLGETWYAEADTPLGPWAYARKIVTHDKYSFYNPKQHPVFDKDGGRVIYFEGTYANTFSGNPDKTPRYDYNQIMYKLNLADERLALPVPVYRLSCADEPDRLATARHLPALPQPREVAFFALDRPRAGVVAVRQDAHAGAGARLAAVPVADAAGDDRAIVFYGLPADQANPSPTTALLYEFAGADGQGWAYSTDPEWSQADYTRSAVPLCRVWHNPMSAPLSKRLSGPPR